MLGQEGQSLSKLIMEESDLIAITLIVALQSNLSCNEKRNMSYKQMSDNPRWLTAINMTFRHGKCNITVREYSLSQT